MVVGVAGYYGFRNAGDEAILEAIARELQARGHEVVALSGDPKRTREDHGLRAYHRLNPLALLRADLWLLGGGGLLQDATSALSLTYYLSVLRLARLFRKRVVVFNQSLGPLSPWGERGRLGLVWVHGSRAWDGVGADGRGFGDGACCVVRLRGRA